MDRVTLARLFAALEAEGVDYVLVGGLALNLHGIARATEDVDLFVRAEEGNVARLRQSLRRVVDDLEAEHFDLDGIGVRLATPRTLWRMKRDTTRAVDAEDAARLEAAFGLRGER